MTTNRDFAAANAKSLARLALAQLGEPPTDWHKEAQMYAECLGKVKQYCEQQHQGMETLGMGTCQCRDCETKRRVLRIITDSLK